MYASDCWIDPILFCILLFEDHSAVDNVTSSPHLGSNCLLGFGLVVSLLTFPRNIPLAQKAGDEAEA